MSSNSRLRSRVIGAAALLALVVVPVALAATEGGSSSPQAITSSVKGKVKKLTQQVQQLQQRVDELAKQPGPQGPEGAQGPPGPSTGPAGGDLTGNYPNPEIAANVVGGPEIAANAVGVTEIADGGVTSGEVADNSITGGDVDEATLGQVPSAANADSVNGLRVDYHFGNPVTFGNQTENNGSWLSGTSVAGCTSEETAIAGGGVFDNANQSPNEALAITESHLALSTSNPNGGWEATAISDADNDTFWAFVVCFEGG